MADNERITEPENQSPAENTATMEHTQPLDHTAEAKPMEAKPDEAQPVQSNATAAKKLPAKKLAIIGAAVIAVIAVILFVVYGLPAIRYSNGVKAFDSKDYHRAAEIFSKLDDYKDSDSYLKQANMAIDYADAVEAYNNSDYSRAAELFATLDDYKDSKTYRKQADLGIHYTNANAKVQEGKYDEAIKEYINAKNFQDAKTLLLQAYDLQGETLFKEKQYAKAAEAFSNAGNNARVLDCGVALVEEQNDYSSALTVLENDTSEKAQLYLNYANGMLSMESEDYQAAIGFFTNSTGLLDTDTRAVEATFQLAEKCLREGYLNKAKSLYDSLPEDYAQGEITAADRITLLNKNKKLLDLVGNWNATDTYYKVQADSTTSSYYYYWYQDSIKLGTVTVTCPYNDADGIFTIKGTATFPSYQNFSSSASKLRTDMESFTFSTTSTGTIPYQIDSSRTTKLSFSGNMFDLQYKYVNESSNVYWHYTFTSKVKYGSRTMLAEDR